MAASSYSCQGTSPHPLLDESVTQDDSSICSTINFNSPQTKTVLRMKRRMEESPSKILLMSYKRCRFSSSGKIDIKENVPEEINRVFRLAGTVDKNEVDDDQSISKTIQDALEVVERNKALDQFEKLKARENNRCYKRRVLHRHLDKTKEENKKQAVDNRFRVISQKRGLPMVKPDDIDKNLPNKLKEDEYEPTLLFNLLDLVAEDEPTEKKHRSGADVREVGSITMNGVPMIKHGNGTGTIPSSTSGFVYDLYVAKDVLVEDQFQNQFVSVRPADDDYEFDFENYGDSDEELPQDDDDSNDEDNWRNDYPDSDPDSYPEHGQAYGYEQADDDFIGKFANVRLRGEELSSDDDGEFVYSTASGCDDGLGGMYNNYKSRLQIDELADEVVSSSSDSNDD